MSITLKNKPLVEAIFELKWTLKERTPNIKLDPHYKILVGRLYDRLKNEYPFHEQLPTAEMPDEIASYIPQHRFRVDENKWPLIQVGPGILTINETEDYLWGDFKKMIMNAVAILFDAYPESKETLDISSVLLRYIDSVPFNFQKENILEFLAKKMNTKISLSPELFKNNPIKPAPSSLNLLFSFNLDKPKSNMSLRFAKGKRNNIDSFFWETIIKSNSEGTPKDPDNIVDWIEASHKITDDWFFKLIKGELLESFK